MSLAIFKIDFPLIVALSVQKCVCISEIVAGQWQIKQNSVIVSFFASLFLLTHLNLKSSTFRTGQNKSKQKQIWSFPEIPDMVGHEGTADCVVNWS